VVGLEGIVRDISPRKELESKLLGAQRMEAVGRLAGGIAHDFNNMLSVMASYSTFVLEALPQGDAAREDMQVIQDTIKRSASLTRQLLAFSRRQVLRMETVDLNELVTQMEKMLRRVIGEDVQLVARLAENLGKVSADPSQIEQILMNLVVNARDAMPNGGTLTLETANLELGATPLPRQADLKPGPYVQLIATDTGTGMSEEVLAHIFEPFFTTKDVGEGTGLGLATVYGIVAQMNGGVWAESELGRGTSFHIVLPRTATAAGVAAPEAAEADGLRGWETVLLVEDEDMVRAAASRILQHHGYTVLTASSGRAAEEICRRAGREIDLVLSDVVMPGMSGPQMVERLIGQHPGLKVLYMTGYTDSTLGGHLGDDHQPEVLHKPFSPEMLLRKVRHVLTSGH
jgi:nitrogen-specific signal transduction histidine kinase